MEKHFTGYVDTFIIGGQRNLGEIGIGATR